VQTNVGGVGKDAPGQNFEHVGQLGVVAPALAQFVGEAAHGAHAAQHLVGDVVRLRQIVLGGLGQFLVHEKKKVVLLVRSV